MRTVRYLRRLGTLAVVPAVAMLGMVGPMGAVPSGATTDPTTLSGQGGSFLQPVMEKLVSDDDTTLAPLYGAYTNTGIDTGIASFVGTGPGQFGADFAVSERPLTTAEAATAAADGRSFAYVPFAATPVAIVALVPSANWANSASQSITAADFCQHLPLSVDQLGQLFGLDSSDPLSKWGDARIDCPETGGGSTADNVNVSLWANLDPSMSNKALMSLLDSTMTSKAYFDAGLAGQGSLTTNDTPSELWPYSGNTIPGGDEPLLGKLLGLNSETNAPSNDAIDWALGAIAPISSVWTGAPLGVPWNIPTAAIDNAATDPVVPSTAAAEAAEGDATLAATSSPTSNNLVTFVADKADTTAYNNFLMEESYLVVPTNGLSAAKATGLAQFIRFVLGPQGQQDIEDFGAAGATPAMVAAGQKVAAELDAGAVAATNPTASVSVSSTTTTTTTTATTAAAGSGGTGSGTSSSGGVSDPSGDGSSASTTGATSGLAFTGSPDVGILVGFGVSLFLVMSLVRRRLRRREVPS
jgi:ABC-type phosphate transport system substrate-binding protein